MTRLSGEILEESLRLLFHRPVGCLFSSITVVAVVTSILWPKQDWGGYLGFIGLGGIAAFIGFYVLQALPAWEGYEDPYLRWNGRCSALGFIVIGSVAVVLGTLALILAMFGIMP